MLEPTLNATPLEAIAKIREGVWDLASWGFQIARHPVFALVSAFAPRLNGLLQELRAHADSNRLCQSCKEARSRPPKREPPAPHRDQTMVHLGPHHVDHHPVPGGIRVHPAPTIHPTGPIGVKHPRAMSRHH